MNLKSIILLLVVLTPFIGFGQSYPTQTLRDSIQYISPYRDLRAVPCIREAQGYYNPEDEKIYHGKMTIRGNDNLKGGYRNDQQHYEETRNYNQGVLNGAFAQSYNHSGNGSYGGNYTISHQWNMTGNFKEGVPHGNWKFSLNSHLNSSSEKENTHRVEQAIYEHGKLKSLTDQNGQRLTFDEQGLISGQGKLKDGSKVELQHSIVCNTYRNQMGDMLRTGAKQQQIINEIISSQGEYDIFHLIDRGYAIDWQEAFISQFTRYAEHLDRYVQIDQISPYFPLPAYSVRIGYLQEIKKVNDGDAVEYFIQRQKEFGELMRNGYFIRWHAKRYFGSNAAAKIRELWLENQQELLVRKFNLITNLTADTRWEETLINCRKGNNALTDLFACKWSKQNLTTEEAYNEIAHLIDEKLKSLHPIVGIEILDAHCTPQSNMVANCIVHKGNLDSVGYESIKMQITTNSEGYILLNRMHPETYQRQTNVWDTIYRLEDSVSKQHLEVRKLLYNKQYRDFKNYFETIMADKSNIPEVRMADLKELQQLQKETAQNAPLLHDISIKHSAIQARLHQYKYMLKLYNSYYENLDPTWDSHTEDLESLLQTQQQIIKTRKKSQLPSIERSLKRKQATSIKELIELL